MLHPESRASARFSKFVIQRGTLGHELRKPDSSAAFRFEIPEADSRHTAQEFQIGGTSARFSKFVIQRGTLGHELRKPKGTTNSMILVPLFDLKFLRRTRGTRRRNFKSAALVPVPGLRAADKRDKKRRNPRETARIAVVNEAHRRTMSPARGAMPQSRRNHHAGCRRGAVRGKLCHSHLRRDTTSVPATSISFASGSKRRRC